MRAHLVGTETLQGVVGELVSDVDQAVVGVDVVQTVGLGLAGRLAHVLAVTKQAVEVELVRVFAVGGQAGIAGGGGEIRLMLGPMREGRRHRLGTGLLFLKLQKTRFDLRLGVLQGGGGQSGVGHGGRHLRDAASQLLPAQQGGRRGAVAPGSGQVSHVHGGVVSRRHRGSGLQGGSLAGLFGLTELSVRLHFQGGSEVEADG